MNIPSLSSLNKWFSQSTVVANETEAKSSESSLSTSGEINKPLEIRKCEAAPASSRGSSLKQLIGCAKLLQLQMRDLQVQLLYMKKAPTIQPQPDNSSSDGIVWGAWNTVSSGVWAVASGVSTYLPNGK